MPSPDTVRKPNGSDGSVAKQRRDEAMTFGSHGHGENVPCSKPMMVDVRRRWSSCDGGDSNGWGTRQSVRWMWRGQEEEKSTGRQGEKFGSSSGHVRLPAQLGLARGASGESRGGLYKGAAGQNRGGASSAVVGQQLQFARHDLFLVLSSAPVVAALSMTHLRFFRTLDASWLLRALTGAQVSGCLGAAPADSRPWTGMRRGAPSPASASLWLAWPAQRSLVTCP